MCACKQVYNVYMSNCLFSKAAADSANYLRISTAAGCLTFPAFTRVLRDYRPYLRRQTFLSLPLHHGVVFPPSHFISRFI